MSVGLANQETAVYRFYGRDEVLLYVGITNDLERRKQQHKETKTWWPEVTREAVTWFALRRDAEIEEQRAIREERPLHNVKHNQANRNHGGFDTAIRSFDHSEVALLPEYQAASLALDRLAHANLGEMSRDHFVEMIRTMAAALVYSDGCDVCMDSRQRGRSDPAHPDYAVHAPFAATISEDGWLRGNYACGRGHRWRCGYSTNQLLWPG